MWFAEITAGKIGRLEIGSPQPSGRAFSVSSGPSGVTMTWLAGGTATGFQVLRLANGVLTSFPAVGTLPPGTATFVDLTPPAGLTCYALLVLGPSQKFSDLECALVGFHSPTGSPQGFTIKLNQSSTATLSWSPPTGVAYDGYLLVTFGGAVQPLSATTTSATLPANGFTCYAVAATQGGVLVGYSDFLCGSPGFSTV
jgi:hypothetical protein